MRDIGVTHIGRQGDEVARDRIALCAAFLQDLRREAMAEIVNARPPGPPRGNVRKLQDAAEGIVTVV